MESKIDKHGVFKEAVFTYRVTKSYKVFISYNGKQVTVLSDKKADEFIMKINNKSHKESQLIMAKTTGNFKRGNEKQEK